jgi:hypothetical protein
MAVIDLQKVGPVYFADSGTDPEFLTEDKSTEGWKHITR